MARQKTSVEDWGVEAFGATHRGRVRPENEDAFAVLLDEGIFVVADGIGGVAGGAVASQITVEVVPAMVRKRLGRLRKNAAREKVQQAVREALRDVNEAMLRKAHEYGGVGNMGTTIVMAVLWKKSILITHLGDSRAYYLRGNAIERLTEDHALAAQLVRWGQITDSEAETNPGKSTLTRHLGAAWDPEPDLRWLKPEPGCRLLLCTDGLTSMLNDEEIACITNSSASAESCCKTLVARANEAGGKDNVTVLALQFQETRRQSGKREHSEEAPS